MVQHDPIRPIRGVAWLASFKRSSSAISKLPQSRDPCCTVYPLPLFTLADFRSECMLTPRATDCVRPVVTRREAALRNPRPDVRRVALSYVTAVNVRTRRSSGVAAGPSGRPTVMLSRTAAKPPWPPAGPVATVRGARQVKRVYERARSATDRISYLATRLGQPRRPPRLNVRACVRARALVAHVVCSGLTKPASARSFCCHPYRPADGCPEP